MKSTNKIASFISIFSLVVVIFALGYLALQFQKQNKSTTLNPTTTNNFDIGKALQLDKLNIQTPQKIEIPKPQTQEIKRTITDPNKYVLDIKVLTYHHIGPTLPAPLNNSIETGLRVGPETFEAQMKKLVDAGYTTLTIEEYENIVFGNKPKPEKAVLLTLDDGFVDNYDNAFRILEKYKLKGNFAIITGILGQFDYMNLDQLKEISRAGHGIMAHTNLHCTLSNKAGTQINPGDEELKPCPKLGSSLAMTVGQATFELGESKKFLEKELGIKVNSIVYPFGYYNAQTLEIDKKVGFEFGFTTKGETVRVPPELELLQIGRTSVQGQQSTTLTGFFAGI
jgi:peptidoglycan/xylan/chitin deacetylase (PgdA/CDA1 family)